MFSDSSDWVRSSVLFLSMFLTLTIGTYLAKVV